MGWVVHLLARQHELRHASCRPSDSEVVNSFQESGPMTTGNGWTSSRVNRLIGQLATYLKQQVRVGHTGESIVLASALVIMT